MSSFQFAAATIAITILTGCAAPPSQPAKKLSSREVSSQGVGEFGSVISHRTCVTLAGCDVAVYVEFDNLDPTKCDVKTKDVIVTRGPGQVINWVLKTTNSAARFKFVPTTGITIERNYQDDDPDGADPVENDPAFDFVSSTNTSFSHKVRENPKKRRLKIYTYSIAIQHNSGNCAILDPIIINRD